MHAIVECVFRTLVKGNANFSELPHFPDMYGGNIDVSFGLSTKEPLCVTHLPVVLHISP